MKWGVRLKQKVLFVYNWVPDDQRKNEFSESASTETVTLIKEALTSYDMQVISLNLLNPNQMDDVIKDNMPIDLAFVIAEGFLDEPSSLFDGTGALRVRQVLESHHIPYTHSGIKSMEVCRNKDITYQMLENKGVNIPRFFVFLQADDLENIVQAEFIVGYPMFIKPSGGGNSIGVDEQSIVHDRYELINKLNQLRTLTGEQPIIAETYLSGREYTVGIIGNEAPYVMPIIAFPEQFTVRSLQVKKLEYKERDRFEIFPPTDLIGRNIRDIALQTFDALEVRDLIRIDLKQDNHGRIFVIDVNGTPSLAMKGSLSFMAESIGIHQQELVGFLLYTTMVRNSLPINDRIQDNALMVIARLQGDFDNQVA